MRKYVQGITLVELMIVVVVVSILAAVAYPNYRQYVQRAQRTEAKAALLRVASSQERFYLQNSTFTNDMTVLGFGTDPYTTDSGQYVVDMTAADGATYTAEANRVPTDAESGKCDILRIDAAGTRSSLPKLDCWTRGR